MAADRAWFSYVNHSKTATLTASSEETAMPVLNLRDRLTYRVWRTQSQTANINLAWGASVTWQVIQIAFPPVRDPASTMVSSIDPTDLITLRASNVSLGATELLFIDQAAISVNRVRGYYTYVASAPVTSQYLQMTIDAVSRTAFGYFDAATLHVGPLFQPAVNFTIGSGYDLQERSLVSTAPFDGATFVQSRARLLGFSGGWDYIPDTEIASWQDMQEKVGTTQPIAFGTTAIGDLSRKAFTGRFDEPLQLSFRGAGNARSRVDVVENR